MTSISVKNSYGGAEASSVEDDLTLDEMLTLFAQCLRGAGYCFKGELVIEEQFPLAERISNETKKKK